VQKRDFPLRKSTDLFTRIHAANFLEMKWTGATRCFLLLFLFCFSCFQSQAQFETASVLGYVRDSSGAPVANSRVQLINTATGVALEVTTDSEGKYQFTDVHIGRYKIDCSASAMHLNFPTVTPESFNPATFDALDREITSVFPVRDIITPDDVRGSYATLNEAVIAGKWPTLSQARGKIIFLMDQKKMGPVYLEGHPSLKGRILFTNTDPGTPDAAFIEQNDASAEAINALVKEGYLIRTRADADTKQGRTNDTSRRDVVLSSGAQIVSTDYPALEPAATGYKVELPGNAVARCNPIFKPIKCADVAIATRSDF
jgi:Phosphoinositide phospholipase C, Ca2+-dependent/Carboxypeptidase regulatory-like domain